MLVTLDVSQLSGLLNCIVPCRGSQAGHTVCGASCGPRHAGGGGRSRCVHVGGGRDCRLYCGCSGENAILDWGRAGRNARKTSRSCSCDAGRVPVQELVEGRRALPRVASRAHGLRGELRAGRREAAQPSAVHAACRGEGATADCGGGERGEAAQRTANMLRISVTRDMSQPEMFALKLRITRKR